MKPQTKDEERKETNTPKMFTVFSPTMTYSWGDRSLHFTINELFTGPTLGKCKVSYGAGPCNFRSLIFFNIALKSVKCI